MADMFPELSTVMLCKKTFPLLSQHFSGLEEAVYKNIDACKELARTTRSAYGPHGKSTTGSSLLLLLVM